MEVPGAGEHLAAAGTLGFKHFKPSAAPASCPGESLGSVRGARRASAKPPAGSPLFGSPTPQPGCLFLPLPGCESLRSLVSVAAFEGIYKPRSSPLRLLEQTVNLALWLTPALSSSPVSSLFGERRCAGAKMLPLP